MSFEKEAYVKSLILNPLRDAGLTVTYFDKNGKVRDENKYKGYVSGILDNIDNLQQSATQQGKNASWSGIYDSVGEGIEEYYMIEDELHSSGSDSPYFKIVNSGVNSLIKLTTGGKRKGRRTKKVNRRRRTTSKKH
jgi:hypothetical protein